MPTLNNYIADLRETLHDPTAVFWTNAQLTNYINRARRQVAQKGQCVRMLPPSTAGVASVTVNSGGSGYTTATATVADPDGNTLDNSIATVQVTVGGGQVTGITVLTAGAGYVAIPAITITGDGTGATATPVLTPHLFTTMSQEAYDLSEATTILQALHPGCGAVQGVQSVSVSWGAMRPSLSFCDWSSLQAYMRAYQPGLQNYPAVWSPYGDAETGKIYLWPAPSGTYAMEWDCYCDVLALSQSQTVDLIPALWMEAVTSYAAYLAYQNAQRANDAQAQRADHNNFMVQARTVVTPARVPNPYAAA